MIHGKGLYLNCYNIKGLIMFPSNDDFINYVHGKKYIMENKEEIAKCKYPYPQLINMFNNIHNDFQNKIQTKVPAFKYLPIVIPDIPNITDVELSENEHSYIYIIHERDFINAKQPIYKIGKTTKTIQTRYVQYPKNSKLLFTQHVNNCHIVEKNIIRVLTEKFKIRKDIGSEYFEGKLNDIIKCVIDVCYENIM